MIPSWTSPRSKVTTPLQADRMLNYFRVVLQAKENGQGVTLCWLRPAYQPHILGAFLGAWVSENRNNIANQLVLRYTV